MREFELHTKDMSKGIHAITGDYGRVRVFIHENCMSTGESYLLENFHYEKLASYKSVSALIKYAKANEFIPSNQIQQPKAVTLCPVPAPAPAKSAAKGQGILFVEVETNGRGKDTEVIEIAIVSEDETVLFHTFVKPSKPMKKDGLTVDDIHHSDLVDAPTLDRIWSAFAAVIGRSPIAFYNAEYCKKMIIKSLSKAFDAQVPNNFASLFPYNKVLSVSERYQHFNNYSSGYFQNNRSQYLNQACGQQGIIWRDLPNNRAASSAIKCARLHKLLNDKELPA